LVDASEGSFPFRSRLEEVFKFCPLAEKRGSLEGVRERGFNDVKDYLPALEAAAEAGIEHHVVVLRLHKFLKGFLHLYLENKNSRQFIVDGYMWQLAEVQAQVKDAKAEGVRRQAAVSMAPSRRC
jgi:hypothetical protein